MAGRDEKFKLRSLSEYKIRMAKESIETPGDAQRGAISYLYGKSEKWADVVIGPYDGQNYDVAIAKQLTGQLIHAELEPESWINRTSDLYWDPANVGFSTEEWVWDPINQRDEWNCYIRNTNWVSKLFADGVWIQAGWPPQQMRIKGDSVYGDDIVLQLRTSESETKTFTLPASPIIFDIIVDLDFEAGLPSWLEIRLLNNSGLVAWNFKLWEISFKY